MHSVSKLSLKERSNKPNNHRCLLVLGLFKRCLRRNERFWSPLINQIIDFLQPHPSAHPSLSSLHPSQSQEEITHLLRQLDKIPILRTITRAQKIPHEEDDEHQLNGAADRVVLVAALDVPDEHGRSGHLLEAGRDLVDRADYEPLRVLELHVLERAVEDRHCNGALW